MTSLFIAADGLLPKETETLAALGSLADTDELFGIKVNLDYLLARGEVRALKKLRPFGKALFCDLKMWNGSRTMVDVAKIMVDQGVEFFNIYALADTLIPEVAAVTKGTATKLLIVTVLTHYDEDYCKKHFRRSLPETVQHFADIGLGGGGDGIILPGTTLDAVSDLETIKVVPGARPSWYQDTRHKEEIEPGLAAEKGANIIVCGSPIMKSDKPPSALRRILSEFSPVT